MSPTPFVSKRAPLFADVPDEKWNDWRWQLSNRLNSVEDFEQVLRLTDSERKALSSPGLFRVDVTPYFVSLIDPDDPNDPLRRQVIPTAREVDAFTGMMEDSLAEDRHSPLPGLVHRYPDSGVDAGNHPVRDLLPLLHPRANRWRPQPDFLAQRVGCTDRVSEKDPPGEGRAAFRR